MAIISAPFTEAQVNALHVWQSRPDVHPFTCADAGHPQTHLVPTTAGWVCPKCAYTQNWAHDFMTTVIDPAEVAEALGAEPMPAGPAWPAGHFVGGTGGIGHILAQNSRSCPQCSAPPSRQTLRNYDRIWRDGDVVCLECGTRVRGYDAG